MDNKKFLTALGARIKKVRSDKHRTQKDLAADCDFEKTNMSRIESGRTNPTILTLLKISTALNIHIWDLLDNRDGKAKKKKRK